MFILFCHLNVDDTNINGVTKFVVSHFRSMKYDVVSSQVIKAKSISPAFGLTKRYLQFEGRQIHQNLTFGDILGRTFYRRYTTFIFGAVRVDGVVCLSYCTSPSKSIKKKSVGACGGGL